MPADLRAITAFTFSMPRRSAPAGNDTGSIGAGLSIVISKRTSKDGEGAAPGGAGAPGGGPGGGGAGPASSPASARMAKYGGYHERLIKWVWGMVGDGGGGL